MSEILLSCGQAHCGHLPGWRSNFQAMAKCAHVNPNHAVRSVMHPANKSRVTFQRCSSLCRKNRDFQGFVQKERLFPSTNCCLAPMGRDLAWRKLQALAEVTKLAKQRLAAS